MAKEKKMTPSKPAGTGNTRLKFDEKVSISPNDGGKKKNPALETSLFNKEALGAEVAPTSRYASKKKGTYESGLCDYKANKISPTADY